MERWLVIGLAGERGFRLTGRGTSERDGARREGAKDIVE